MNIVIFANGQYFSNAVMKEKTAKADCIIAADGGLHNCLKNNITPHYVVGDMDSVNNIDDKLLGKTEILHIAEQDTTDIEKALNFAETLKPLRIDIFYSFGRRTDHSLANILILNQNNNIAVNMHDEYGFFKVFEPGNHYYKGKRGVTISLFTISQLSNIELSGFEFALTKNSIGPGFIGVSNKISENIASIRFAKGKLLIYELYD